MDQCECILWFCAVWSMTESSSSCSSPSDVTENSHHAHTALPTLAPNHYRRFQFDQTPLTSDMDFKTLLLTYKSLNSQVQLLQCPPGSTLFVPILSDESSYKGGVLCTMHPVFAILQSKCHMICQERPHSTGSTNLWLCSRMLLLSPIVPTIPKHDLHCSSLNSIHSSNSTDSEKLVFLTGKHVPPPHDLCQEVMVDWVRSVRVYGFFLYIYRQTHDCTSLL